MMLWKEWNSDN